MKTSVSSRREAHFCFSVEATNASKKPSEIKEIPPKMERQIDMFFRLVFFRILGQFWAPELLEISRKSYWGRPPAFLKPSWCPETFLKRPGLDFGAPKTRFWKAWDSFLKGCGHHVGVCCELFSIASFFSIHFSYVRTHEQTYVRMYVRPYVRTYVHARTHAFKCPIGLGGIREA